MQELYKLSTGLSYATEAVRRDWCLPSEWYAGMAMLANQSPLATGWLPLPSPCYTCRGSTN